jgi:hypothetical protein
MRFTVPGARLVVALFAVLVLVANAPAAAALAAAGAARIAGPSLQPIAATTPGRVASAVARAMPLVEPASLDRTGEPDLAWRHPVPVGPIATAPVPSRRHPAAHKQATSTPRPATHLVPRASAPTYRGTNHMWMPALGISRSVTFFPCSRSTPPGLAVYRWGCAGANNVYLFAHAYAAFRPLHDAYVSGRLRRGMKVVYADGSGRVHVYAIAWWRLTTPDNGAFAFAAQSRPSLTLQTCVGAQSQYRLIVRLYQVS